MTNHTTPPELAKRLADLHRNSISPTGKFGFHARTCHTKIIQAIDVWDDSWCVVFCRHLGHIIDLASPILQSPKFDAVSKLVLDEVVPRLLLPLQSDGGVSVETESHPRRLLGWQHSDGRKYQRGLCV